MSTTIRPTNEDFSEWLEQAVRLVRKEAENLEKNVFDPLWRRYFGLISTNPVTAVFLTLFLSLSVLPMISFLAFGLLVASTFSFMAFMVVGFATAFSVAIAASILFMTLAFISFFSTFIASMTFGTIILYRLYIHISTPSPDSLRIKLEKWAGETYTRFGLPKRPSSSPTANGAKSVSYPSRGDKISKSDDL